MKKIVIFSFNRYRSFHTGICKLTIVATLPWIGSLATELGKTKSM